MPTSRKKVGGRRKKPTAGRVRGTNTKGKVARNIQRLTGVSSAKAEKAAERFVRRRSSSKGSTGRRRTVRRARKR